MARLSEIVNWLDSYLNISQIPDYPNAYNGLQAENDGSVETIVTAVDASLNTIQQAVKLKADLLLVHHGLFWQGVEMLTGAWREKCQLLLDHNIALYSAHLPLDVHPVCGNNILLAQALDLKNITPCLPWKGINLAVKGSLQKNRNTFLSTLEKELNAPPQAFLFGEEFIDELFIITGGAGSEITRIYEVGGTNFLTGEGSHWNIPYAEEKKINFFLGTHYLTETYGVNTLGSLIHKDFSLKKHEKIKSINYL